MHGRADGSTDYRYQIQNEGVLVAGFNILCCDAAHDGSAVAALIAQFFTAYHFRRPSLTHLHHHHLHHHRWMKRDTGA